MSSLQAALVLSSILFLVAVSGCAYVVTIGKEIDPQKVAQIQKGKTTAQEIVNLFGPPYSKEVEETGEKWTYLHSSMQVPSAKGRTKTLSLFLRDGVVMNFLENETDTSAKTSVAPGGTTADPAEKNSQNARD